MGSVSKFVEEVCKREGKKQSVNITQTREIVRIVRTLLRKAGIDIYTIIGSVDNQTFTKK